MQVDEFKLNQELKDEKTLAQAKVLLEAAETIEGLVYSWMAEHRKIKFCPGEDDDHKISSLCLILMDGGEDVAEIYIHLERLAQLCPNNVPVSQADSSGTDKDAAFLKDHSRTDAWFEQRDARLSVEYSDVLCGSVIKPKAAIEVAISYATAENGSATLEMADEDSVSDITEGEEPDIFKREGLMWLDLEYLNKHTRQGWGENMYVSA